MINILSILLILCLLFLLKFKYKLLSCESFNLKIENNRLYIFQTYHTKSLIPTKVYENIKEYAPNYIHKIFNDNECKEFILKEYGTKYLNVFNTLKKGAHKADLWRYCILYKYGGVYLDIKTKLTKNIDEIFIDKTKMYIVESNNGYTIHNGIIYSPPKNKLLLYLIEHILKNIKNVDNYYLLFCHEFYNLIKKKSLNKSICKFTYLKMNDNIPDIYIYKEICSNNKEHCSDGLNKSNNQCCTVNDKYKNRIMQIRYADSLMMSNNIFQK
jgi:hypothetical protein